MPTATTTTIISIRAAPGGRGPPCGPCGPVQCVGLAAARSCRELEPTFQPACGRGGEGRAGGAAPEPSRAMAAQAAMADLSRAVDAAVDRLDVQHLRPRQKRAFECSAACCDGQMGSSQLGCCVCTTIRRQARLHRARRLRRARQRKRLGI